MERIVYQRMEELDSKHWWYRARREILSDLIARKIEPKANGRVLEVGCGTGHNLAMLGRFGTVDAVEIDSVARGVAEKRLGKPISGEALPELKGIDRGAYDLVASLDVVEHVEDDVAALKALASCVAPGGRLLITVPAFPFMWSAHDVVNHHHRRYTRKTLKKAIADAGLELELLSWFNSVLFPLAATARLWGRVTGKEDSDDALPPAPVNRLFEALFGLERHLVGRVWMPPGVSLVAVIRPQSPR